MATIINLPDEFKTFVDALIRDGRYASPDEVVADSLRRLRDDDEAALADDLSEADLAAIRQGLAESDAGQLYDAEEVFAELRERYRRK